MNPFNLYLKIRKDLIYLFSYSSNIFTYRLIENGNYVSILFYNFSPEPDRDNNQCPYDCISRGPRQTDRYVSCTLVNCSPIQIDLFICNPIQYQSRKKLFLCLLLQSERRNVFWKRLGHNISVIKGTQSVRLQPTLS